MASKINYVRGDDVVLFANFVNFTGGEAQNIVEPKITIKHINSSDQKVIDVNEAGLIQFTTNDYYYKYSIPLDADLTDYFVIYSATVDGAYIEGTDTFRVIEVGVSQLTGITEGNYTTKSRVAGMLEGIEVSDIWDEWLDFADSYIDSYTQTQFRETIMTEYYDVRNTRTDTIFLNHYPILDIKYVKNDGEELDKNSLAIYYEEGIVKLKADYYWEEIAGLRSYFTRGDQTVEVKYSWGTSQVPTIITYFATLLAANMAIKSYPGKVRNIVKSEKIGDYTISFNNRDFSFSDEIEKTRRFVIDQYRHRVHQSVGG